VLKTEHFFQDLSETKRSLPPYNVAQKNEQRDIYYIICDGYAGQSTYEKYYDFKNQSFYDFLNENKFAVASKSVSNYPFTRFSLTSSLNMKYLDYIRDDKQRKYDETRLYKELRGNETLRYIKTQGYKYVHIANLWGPSRVNPHADINYTLCDDREMVDELVEFSLLNPILSMSGDYKFKREQRTLLFQLETLKKMPELDGPKFVFAHVMAPHIPYLFDENGQPLTPALLANRPEKENYVKYTKFINKKIEEVVTTILKKSKKEPIIVLQADHGRVQWTIGPMLSPKYPDNLKVHFRIMNAFYLPGQPQNAMPEDVTPVNSFRYIFNMYFNAGFEILPNRSNISGDNISYQNTVEAFRNPLDVYQYVKFE
jgi:hypothetical protein